MVSGEAPAVSSHVLSLCAAQRSLLSFPLLIRSPLLTDEGPTLMTSFNLSYLLKGPVSKYSHFGE